MEKLYLTLIFAFLIISGSGQTVVVMEIPEQPEKFIEAYTLFEDALPNGIPTAIGIMGYDISGGTKPYSYRWLENENILSSAESFLLYPEPGRKYFFEVSDKHKCTVTIPILVDQIKHGTLDNEKSVFDKIKINLTRGLLSVSFDETVTEDVELMLSDTGGKRILTKKAVVPTAFGVNLLPGIYLLHLKTDNEYDVRKFLIF